MNNKKIITCNNKYFQKIIKNFLFSSPQTPFAIQNSLFHLLRLFLKSTTRTQNCRMELKIDMGSKIDITLNIEIVSKIVIWPEIYIGSEIVIAPKIDMGLT